MFLDDAILPVKYTLYRAEGKYKLTSPKMKSNDRVIEMLLPLIRRSGKRSGRRLLVSGGLSAE